MRKLIPNIDIVSNGNCPSIGWGIHFWGPYITVNLLYWEIELDWEDRK
jgi:hypothetical protein